MMFTCGAIGYVFVLQSLVLYGLYPYVVEQLDSLMETSSCVGINVYRCGPRWRSECHIVNEHSVVSVVVGLVADSAEWEKQLLNNVVPILACLKGREQLSTVTVEGDTLVGKALAASVVSKAPLVTGKVTQTTMFEEIRKQFLSEFAGLDPLSVLEYFRIRLIPVVQERSLDRLPNLREVSIRCVKNKKKFLCILLPPFCVFFEIDIFRPHISQIGEENYDLCCVFFPKFAEIPLASIHLHKSDEQV